MAGDPIDHPFAAAPGTVYGFRTSPLFPDSHPITDRYGAMVILGHREEMAMLGVLDGVWTSLPTIEAAKSCNLLRSNRFALNNRPAAFACMADEKPTLEKFTHLGEIELTPAMQKAASEFLRGQVIGMHLSTSVMAAHDVEGEWRWANDRDALITEQERDARRREAERTKEREYQENRLKHLTWEQLLTESPLDNWQPSPPYPPAELREAIVGRIHAACRDFQALGTAPRISVAREILRNMVHGIREDDERHGYGLETEEREDIFRVISEIAFVARHQKLASEAEDWFYE